MNDDLRELRALLESATPGPWERHHSAVVRISVDYVVATTDNISTAAFIAAARNALPALLDEVENLRAKVAAATDYVALVSRIHEVYRNLVMDTQEDRDLHARHVATADKALGLARAALESTP